ncbi:cytochrome c family protein [Sphingomonas lacunae]|uniref:Cytochrome c family protein n=1 Tax=Sphingomonas lacunae TaxID=2698828 RepID=A0A6M4AWU0_9SPHN|nr:cytochrome c family protein [Sphingomonas lacunae]QJQ33608.1 cytochrome c family protein [Sphingomonas lacunae]
MDNRNNTIFGWVLGAGIVALGLTSVSTKFFAPHAPEKAGYAVEGAGGAAGGAAAGPAIETLLQTADAAKGEAVFGKCAACHTINAGGANGIGPNLYGVMGTAIGAHVPSFAYSDALKTHGGNWDWSNMDAWLASPRRFADGTKMSFAGLSSAEDRANLMVYLNAQGSNIPLPAAPAADAAPAEGDAAAAPAEGDAAAAPADAAAAAAPAAS